MKRRIDGGEDSAQFSGLWVRHKRYLLLIEGFGRLRPSAARVRQGGGEKGARLRLQSQSGVSTKKIRIEACGCFKPPPADRNALPTRSRSHRSSSDGYSPTWRA